MEGITKSLSDRIVQQFKVQKDRLRDADIARPDEFRLNIAEIEDRKAARRKAAAAENVKDLSKLRADVEQECIRLRADAGRKLRPLQTSTVGVERSSGEHAETKAYRWVSVVEYGPQVLRAEYQARMDGAEVDYCTELLSWWRTIHAERMNTLDRSALDSLDTEHRSRTGAAELLSSAELLERRLAVLTDGDPFASGHLTRQIELLRVDPEFASMLKAGAVLTP